MRCFNALLPQLLVTLAGFGLAACDDQAPTDPSDLGGNNSDPTWKGMR